MIETHYDDSWLQPLKDYTEEVRRKTALLRQKVEVLEAEDVRLREQRRGLEDRKKVLAQELDEKTKRDAARYRWLRSRKGLELRSCLGYNKWTREDGTTYYQSHQLSEGGTGHASCQTLDETIDTAILVAQERDGEQS